MVCGSSLAIHQARMTLRDHVASVRSKYRHSRRSLNAACVTQFLTNLHFLFVLFVK